MAVITRTVPPDRRSAPMSLWGGVAGLANLLGPVMGGVLVDRFGWEWIFFVNVPLGVAGFALAVRFVPALPTREHKFDVLGLVLSGIGIFLLVFGIQEGDSRHWDTRIWLMIAAGLAVLAVFAVHQSRSTADPLLPLGLFRDRNFALACVAVAAAAAAVAALLVPLYFYLEAVRDMSGTSAGVVVAPMAVLAMVFVPFIAKFGDRIHPRVLPAAGFTLFAVTLVWFASLMTPDSPIAVFLVGAALTGIANAFLWPALAVTATHNLPLHQAGAGAGAYNAIRQVGSVLGSAAISAVIANRMSAHALGTGTGVVGDGGTVTGSVPESVRRTFGSALGESLYLPVGLLVLGLVVSVLFVRAVRPASAVPRAAPARQAAAGPSSGELAGGIGG
jgi:EmrB/QacA subfamily drug resistance transporter